MRAPWWAAPSVTQKVIAYLKEYGSINLEEARLYCGFGKLGSEDAKWLFRRIRQLGYGVHCHFDNRRRNSGQQKWPTTWELIRETENRDIERYLQTVARSEREERAPQADKQGGVDWFASRSQPDDPQT